MKDETFKQLLAVAAKKDIKYTTLIRKIVEQWLWGHMNGPGKKAPGKGKNERLL
jgi:hypothetical protein